MEQREVTARVKIRLNDEGIDVKNKNVFGMFEELHIISIAITMLGANKHDELDSFERDYFDGEDPCVCLAYNIKTGALQVSVNDIPENLELGILESAKYIVMKDLLGDNNATE